MNIQTSSSTPTTPMVAPTARSQRASPPSSVGVRCATTPSAEAGRLAERGHEEEEEDGNRHAIVGTRPAERRHDPRHVVDADDQPDRDTAPREDATDEAEAPATDTREDQGDDEQVRRASSRGTLGPGSWHPYSLPTRRVTPPALLGPCFRSRRGRSTCGPPAAASPRTRRATAPARRQRGASPGAAGGGSLRRRRDRRRR